MIRRTGDVHPNDFLFFQEVCSSMERVAASYSLPLKSIAHLPERYLSFKTDRWGDCDHGGNIRILMRAKVAGKWTDESISPEEVWKTAAHELSHLRHMNHGVAFQAFEYELYQALTNLRKEVDHRTKVIDKLVKMQAQRESEAELGNTAAAEAFATAINRLLLEHELNPSDIDYAAANANDPVVEIRADLKKYRIDRVKNRVAWQETLASIVARAHLCRLLVIPGSNTVIFVGTKSHATIAEYAYGTLVPAANFMSEKEAYFFKLQCNREGRPKESRGYRESWLTSFIARIDERFEEARKQAAADFDARHRDMVASGLAEPVLGAESLAMVRLGGQLQKAADYIDRKFHGKKNTASHISMSWGNNRAGLTAGRAAADRIPMGRKGVSAGGTKGLLGE